VLQVDVHPSAFFDFLANLSRRFAALGFLVGEGGFLHADGTFSAVEAFKAGVEAVMAHGFVATAVAGHLVQHRLNLCVRGHLIDRDLIRVDEVDAGELGTAQHRRQRLGGGAVVVGRNVRGGVTPLGTCGDGQQGDSGERQETLHTHDDSVTTQCVIRQRLTRRKRRIAGVKAPVFRLKHAFFVSKATCFESKENQ
jgi:hypothetical protein